MRKRGISAALVGLIGLLPGVSRADWTLEKIGSVGMYSDLVVDDAGTPHVALCGSDHDLRKIVYATRTPAGWSRTIAGALEGRALGGQVAIALDAEQRPAILYASEQLVLARLGRRGWTQQQVWDTWQGNGECQLVLRFQGREPWVFLHDPYKEPAVQVAHGLRRLQPHTLSRQAEDGGGLALCGAQACAVWQQEGEGAHDPVVYAVDAGRGFGAAQTLVEDSWRRPRVAAAGNALCVLTSTLVDARGNAQLVLHTLRDGAWTHEPGPVVHVEPLAGPYLALSTDGTPHVLFGGSEPKSGLRGVIYATRGRDGAWRVSRVSAASAARMCLRVDAQGRPHAIYAVSGKVDTLFYASPGAAPVSELQGSVRASARRAPRVASGKPQALQGAAAGAIAQQVRERAERWFERRAADELFCAECGGKGDLLCPSCHGQELIRCPTCHGKGEVPRRKAIGEKQRYDTCPDCHRRGELACPQCEHGRVPCARCEEAPGFRHLAGTRAFWRFLSPSFRHDHDCDAFVDDVLRGRTQLACVGEAPALHRAQITQVQVFSNEVQVTARVSWAGQAEGRDGTLTTTWFREDGRFYLAAGSEDREPLLTATGEPLRRAAPRPQRSQATRLLAMARNYMANDAPAAALRKLKQAAQEDLTTQQRAELQELRAKCQVALRH